MTSDSRPSGQPGDKYIIRFPEGMRDRIAEAAKANRRSMNAEIVARLDESFASQLSSPQLATLAADLAKAKRDLAHSAYVGERWLVGLVLLWEIHRDIVKMAELLGFGEEIPKDWLSTAEFIGREANDEFRRHSAEFDPMVLHDLVEASEAEFQAAVAAVARLASKTPVFDREAAAATKALRQRILERRRGPTLPEEGEASATDGDG